VSFAGTPPPRLEVLRRSPACGDAKERPPLLFVHGGFVGAWCWEENFLDWFAARGWDCHAVSLRGHGGSEGRAMLHASGIDDYVADVASVVDGFGRQPVLIGHSMGGFVAQRYLERYPAAAAVLLAPVPATGLAGPGMAVAAGNPALFWDLGMAHEFGRMARNPALLFEAVFGHEPGGGFGQYMARMDEESHRAWLEMCGPGLIDTRRIEGVDILVLGGDGDRVIPPAFIRSAARQLGKSAEILPGLGHALMLEDGWETVAGRIDDWLAGLPN